MTGLKQWRRRGAVWLTALALLAVPLPLSGCDKTVQKEEVQQEEQYTLSQIMTIAATERNRYQKVYTSQIWEAVTDENGTTMKDMLLAQVPATINTMAAANVSQNTSVALHHRYSGSHSTMATIAPQVPGARGR